MRRPTEVDLRSDELRRAAVVRVESEPCAAPAPAGADERTIADDCAAMLEAWFDRMAHHEKAIVLRSEVDDLARRMRNMGVMARYSPAVGKLR